MSAQEIEKRAAQAARNFTRKGIEDLIGWRKRNLAELDELDERLGDRGREARQEGREAQQRGLKIVERALELKVDMHK